MAVCGVDPQSRDGHRALKYGGASFPDRQAFCSHRYHRTLPRLLFFFSMGPSDTVSDSETSFRWQTPDETPRSRSASPAPAAGPLQTAATALPLPTDVPTEGGQRADEEVIEIGSDHSDGAEVELVSVTRLPSRRLSVLITGAQPVPIAVSDESDDEVVVLREGELPANERLLYRAEQHRLQERERMARMAAINASQLIYPNHNDTHPPERLSAGYANRSFSGTRYPTTTRILTREEHLREIQRRSHLRETPRRGFVTVHHPLFGSNPDSYPSHLMQEETDALLHDLHQMGRLYRLNGRQAGWPALQRRMFQLGDGGFFVPPLFPHDDAIPENVFRMIEREEARTNQGRVDHKAKVGEKVRETLEKRFLDPPAGYSNSLKPEEVPVCVLCAVVMGSGIPTTFTGNQKNELERLQVETTAVAPYTALYAVSEVDRDLSRRVFVAKCGHAYCGRCYKNVGNWKARRDKEKEREGSGRLRKRPKGEVPPPEVRVEDLAVSYPAGCVAPGCSGRLRVKNAMTELFY